MADFATFIEIFKNGMDFLKASPLVSSILTVVFCIVILFLLKAICADMYRALKELLFFHWLKKDENFTRFKTEREARKGYKQYLEEKRYASMTKSWRKKLEKKKNPGQFLSLRQRYENLCERLGDLPDMDDIKAFFSRKKLSGQKTGKAE